MKYRTQQSYRLKIKHILENIKEGVLEKDLNLDTEVMKTNVNLNPGEMTKIEDLDRIDPTDQIKILLITETKAEVLIEEKKEITIEEMEVIPTGRKAEIPTIETIGNSPETEEIPIEEMTGSTPDTEETGILPEAAGRIVQETERLIVETEEADPEETLPMR